MALIRIGAVVVLDLNPAIWETIAGTGWTRCYDAPTKNPGEPRVMIRIGEVARLSGGV
jgi:hypothetical protein